MQMQTTTVTQTDVRALADLLIGSFDNASQARMPGSEFALVHYDNRAVTLADAAISDASLYIFAEQIADTPTVQFARRRVMAVRTAANDQLLEIAFYPLADEDKWLQTPRTTLWQGDLGAYECSLFYRREGDRFLGGTPAGGHPHHYRGAATMTIDAELSPQELAVWERWYDADGQQVAGPMSGPYRYRPISV